MSRAVVRHVRSVALVMGLSILFGPLIAGCAGTTNPATGEQTYSLISPEEEKQIGAEQHDDIVAEFGGVYDDPALTAYVNEIGMRLARVSEMPNLDWHFTLLNSDVVNAFALPGGYVYVTRGLLALANDEAQLAAVIGHEIGHVTARHGAQRQTRAIGVGLAGVLAKVLLGSDPLVQLGQTVGQAYIASYSRDQEYQADMLGVRYLQRAGYPTDKMAGFLKQLEANSDLAAKLAGSSGGSGNDFFATHPRTADRVSRAAELGRAAGGGGTDAGRDIFLDRIDGMVFGEDPRQGVIRDGVFSHPDLRMAFPAPQGFRFINTSDALYATNSSGARLKFDVDIGESTRRASTLTGYITDVWAQEVQFTTVRSGMVGGLDLAEAKGIFVQDGKQVELRLYAIRHSTNTIARFLFLTPAAQVSTTAPAIESAVARFRKLSEQEAAAIRPLVVDVIPLAGGETVDDLAERMAVEALPREHLEVINGLYPGGAGRLEGRVKLVVEQAGPGA